MVTTHYGAILVRCRWFHIWSTIRTLCLRIVWIIPYITLGCYLQNLEFSIVLTQRRSMFWVTCSVSTSTRLTPRYVCISHHSIITRVYVTCYVQCFCTVRLHELVNMLLSITALTTRAFSIVSPLWWAEYTELTAFDCSVHINVRFASPLLGRGLKWPVTPSLSGYRAWM